MHSDSSFELDGSDLCRIEIDNFVEIVRRIRPPSQPVRHGTIDIYGDSTFLNGTAGGDHIVYLDFDERYDIDRRIREAAEAGNDAVAAKLAEIRGQPAEQRP